MKRGGLSILYLTKYDYIGASSRYRFLQYFTVLEEGGIRCVASPFFDGGYLRRRYHDGRGSFADLSRAFWRRLRVLLTVRKFDLLVIEKELIPYFPAWLERLLAHLGVPFVAEYDDALFHQYDDSPNPLVRRLLGRKIATVMRLSRLVIAGNSYLADYAGRSGALRVEILPTVIDLDRYPNPEPKDNGVFTIGWVGSPATCGYLGEIADALAEVCRDERARVVVIGAESLYLPGVPAVMVPWQDETEVSAISSLDVGIMPLPDTPWARGKCGFKLVQYMACGLPVVASPVGVNCEIVEGGRNGFLAATKEEWVRALNLLRDDRELRLRLGKAGREKVEQHYCKQVVAPRLVELLRSIGDARK